jgi:hypothetical protein
MEASHPVLFRKDDIRHHFETPVHSVVRRQAHLKSIFLKQSRQALSGKIMEVSGRVNLAPFRPPDTAQRGLSPVVTASTAPATFAEAGQGTFTSSASDVTVPSSTP